MFDNKVKSILKQKLKASFLHLIASAIIVFVILIIVLNIWYPNKLHIVTDATKVLVILFLVDVALGPLLTFIVYNKSKPELRRDLLVIIVLQLSALLYGVYTISHARPAFVVFAVDRFELAYTNEITQKELKEVKIDQFKNIPKLWERPKWISSQLPTDIEELNNLLFQSIEGGKDISKIPKYFRSYNSSKKQIAEKLKPLSAIKNKEKNILEQLDESQYAYLPLLGKTKDFSVILKKSDLSIVKIVEIDPW